MNEKTISRYCPITDEDILYKEAVTYKKEKKLEENLFWFAREEGLLCGGSSGATVACAVKAASSLKVRITWDIRVKGTVSWDSTSLKKLYMFR